jgi:uncharacterized hydrophobic protein (TIGR00271 family)
MDSRALSVPDPERRAALVAGMLRRDPSEVAAYWFQLALAVGIATFGLVLGSGAVIIGAMLIAPLMGPIIGLAMGLSTGSPFLVLRSSGRIVVSMLVAVGGGAAITLLVPFHELNAEISSRTSPTILDLATASFCALAGVYATLRPGSDTSATAAGTSIGISLVPPLCASGFGVGLRLWPVARGASLLFLTNLVAIVVVGTLSFLATGFNRIDVIALEREELAREGRVAPLARLAAQELTRVFESRWGAALRLLMPLTLLAIVYVPLRRALDEVVWEARVRAAAARALETESDKVIRSQVHIERHEVRVLLIIVGDTSDAVATRQRVEATVRKASEVAPSVQVLAIPDANAFAGLAATWLPEPAIRSSPAASPAGELSAVVAEVRGAVERVWPASTDGKVLDVEAGAEVAAPIHVRVVHFGAPLGAEAAEVVRRSLATQLGQNIRLIDAPVPRKPLTHEVGDEALVAAVAAGIHATALVPTVRVCIVRPTETSEPGAHDERETALTKSLDAILALHPRVTTAGNGPWQIQFVSGDCPLATPDGGTSDTRASEGGASH